MDETINLYIRGRGRRGSDSLRGRGGRGGRGGGALFNPETNRVEKDGVPVDNSGRREEVDKNLKTKDKRDPKNNSNKKKLERLSRGSYHDRRLEIEGRGKVVDINSPTNTDEPRNYPRRGRAKLFDHVIRKQVDYDPSDDPANQNNSDDLYSSSDEETFKLPEYNPPKDENKKFNNWKLNVTASSNDNNNHLTNVGTTKDKKNILSSSSEKNENVDDDQKTIKIEPINWEGKTIEIQPINLNKVDSANKDDSNETADLSKTREERFKRAYAEAEKEVASNTGDYDGRQLGEREGEFPQDLLDRLREPFSIDSSEKWDIESVVARIGHGTNEQLTKAMKHINSYINELSHMDLNYDNLLQKINDGFKIIELLQYRIMGGFCHNLQKQMERGESDVAARIGDPFSTVKLSGNFGQSSASKKGTEVSLQAMLDTAAKSVKSQNNKFYKDRDVVSLILVTKKEPIASTANASTPSVFVDAFLDQCEDLRKNLNKELNRNFTFEVNFVCSNYLNSQEWRKITVPSKLTEGRIFFSQKFKLPRNDVPKEISTKNGYTSQQIDINDSEMFPSLTEGIKSPKHQYNFSSSQKDKKPNVKSYDGDFPDLSLYKPITQITSVEKTNKENVKSSISSSNISEKPKLVQMVKKDDHFNKTPEQKPEQKPFTWGTISPQNDNSGLTKKQVEKKLYTDEKRLGIYELEEERRDGDRFKANVYNGIMQLLSSKGDNLLDRIKNADPKKLQEVIASVDQWVKTYSEVGEHKKSAYCQEWSKLMNKERLYKLSYESQLYKLSDKPQKEVVVKVHLRIYDSEKNCSVIGKDIDHSTHISLEALIAQIEKAIRLRGKSTFAPNATMRIEVTSGKPVYDSTVNEGGLAKFASTERLVEEFAQRLERLNKELKMNLGYEAKIVCLTKPQAHEKPRDPNRMDPVRPGEDANKVEIKEEKIQAPSGTVYGYSFEMPPSSEKESVVSSDQREAKKKHFEKCYKQAQENVQKISDETGVARHFKMNIEPQFTYSELFPKDLIDNLYKDLNTSKIYNRPFNNDIEEAMYRIADSKDEQLMKTARNLRNYINKNSNYNLPEDKLVKRIESALLLIELMREYGPAKWLYASEDNTRKSRREIPIFSIEIPGDDTFVLKKENQYPVNDRNGRSYLPYEGICQHLIGIIENRVKHRNLPFDSHITVNIGTLHEVEDSFCRTLKKALQDLSERLTPRGSLPPGETWLNIKGRRFYSETGENGRLIKPVRGGYRIKDL